MKGNYTSTNRYGKTTTPSLNNTGLKSTSKTNPQMSKKINF